MNNSGSMNIYVNNTQSLESNKKYVITILDHLLHEKTTFESNPSLEWVMRARNRIVSLDFNHFETHQIDEQIKKGLDFAYELLRQDADSQEEAVLVDIYRTFLKEQALKEVELSAEMKKKVLQYHAIPKIRASEIGLAGIRYTGSRRIH